MKIASKKSLLFTTELLNHLGNSNPAPKHIAAMEAILSSVITCQPITFDQRLSQREISCLFWAAKGKTSRETAELLRISSSTVESHRKQIKRKLKCYNLTHAVFEGIRHGYIKPKLSLAKVLISPKMRKDKELSK